MKQLTKEQAISFSKNKAYESMTNKEIAIFQLNQKLLCMPFSVFHEAVEKTLCRPVYNHELFLDSCRLLKEINGGKESPSFEHVMGLLVNNFKLRRMRGTPSPCT